MPVPAETSIVLNRLTEYLSHALKDGTLVLLRDNQDGRINSQENERQVSHALRLFTHSNDWFKKAGYTLEVSDARYWYDFCVRGPEGLFIPVNVKVSTLESADNLSSKEGLFYALTGIDPCSVFINAWEKFCSRMAEHMGTVPEADYYFLVVSKVDPGDVFWTSLKSLKKLSANGSNPPYQAKWSANRERVERTNEEATQFLLAIMRQSFLKGANPLLSFDKHLTECLPDEKP